MCGSRKCAKEDEAGGRASVENTGRIEHTNMECNQQAGEYEEPTGVGEEKLERIRQQAFMEGYRYAIAVLNIIL